MIAMLTETVASISVQNDSSIARLKDIEQQIERASQVEDMRALKSTLSECLAVREASRQQRPQSTASIQHLETQMRTSQTHLTAPSQSPPPDSELVLDDEVEVFPQSDFASPDLFFKAVEDFIKQTGPERQSAPARTGAQAWPGKSSA